MKIAFVGKFEKLHDEEYIARSFEMLGETVIRIPQNTPAGDIHRKILLTRPDVLLFTKWEHPKPIYDVIERSKEWGMKTVCWLFDLYWDYEREARIASSSFFKADYVFTTDAGHDEKWKSAKINHQCVRQGIYKDHCVLYPLTSPQGIVFIGSENPFYPERTLLMHKLKEDYKDFQWLGRKDTDCIRGMALNRLYSTKKIVVGDSVYSPHYWSNRVVETLGRGGFLIHQEVEGIKDEYPDLVTYKRGDLNDLKEKINYFLTHEDERQEIVKKNFEHVRNNYTMEKKCAELISKL